ncbi:hypothetical protein [Pseudomonas sp. PS02302]|uniref:hypothetical protein n=1 Tax=Pseudomonas sp. PS02302 TaxID=2991428 RepID=UPI00249C378E|nr:hypothetical protein [Pseudomonas sp. PS02302]
MLLNDFYRRTKTESRILTFIKENPEVDKDAIGLFSFLCGPTWYNALYVVIDGTDNNAEQRINTLWRDSPSFKVLKRSGVTAIQINANDAARVRPLLDGLAIVHEGRLAENALLEVLPLLK